MGYEFSPGSLRRETDSHDLSPVGRDRDAEAAAVLVESNVGSMNLPALFYKNAYGIFVVKA